MCTLLFCCIFIYTNTIFMEQTTKKEDFIRFRIDTTEKNRLETLIKITRRKKSDLYRQAMYNYLTEYFPECLVDLSVQ